MRTEGVDPFPWKYQPGAPIQGRVVLERLELGARPALNVYLIRYDCCGAESTMQEQSLDKAAIAKQDGPSLCLRCRHKAYLMRRAEGKAPRSETPGTPSIGFASWPAPPSTRGW
jgi:hypothetical protein